MEKRGVDEVVLSGGEITERPDLLELVELLSSKELRFTTAITSGRGWSGEVLRASRDIIERVVISLTPEGERDLFGVGTQTTRALSTVELLRDAGFIVQTNTVILPGNISHLPVIAEIVAKLGVQSPIFTLPFPHGRIKEDLDSFVVPWTTLAPLLFEAIDIAERRKPKIKNLPPCYLGSYSRFCSKTTRRYLVQRGRQLERHAVIPPFVGLDFFPVCDGCALMNQCDGFWKEYLELESFPPLAPALPQARFDPPARPSPRAFA